MFRFGSFFNVYFLMVLFPMEYILEMVRGKSNRCIWHMPYTRIVYSQALWWISITLQCGFVGQGVRKKDIGKPEKHGTACKVAIPMLVKFFTREWIRINIFSINKAFLQHNSYSVYNICSNTMSVLYLVNTLPNSH